MAERSESLSLYDDSAPLTLPAFFILADAMLEKTSAAKAETTSAPALTFNGEPVTFPMRSAVVSVENYDDLLLGDQ